MGFSTLSEWLSWILSIHNTEIDLGLDRVQAVAERLNVLHLSGLKIIVAGTNGKGSTVAGLEAIYLAAGFKVGTFTSPILFTHNEQVRINGVRASDADFCAAFERIEKARGEISLTPFEFFTLAGFLIFQQHTLDVLILEVGLGGRLDAVNIIDADAAIITNIDLDHTDRLGNTREKIAFEKAGIFRPNIPVICGDLNPPISLLERAKELNAPIYNLNREFSYQEGDGTWSFQFQHTHYDLPANLLLTQNMAVVVLTVELLRDRLPVTLKSISKGLLQANLPGRIQVIPGEVTEIFDVSHNPAAVALLAKRMRAMQSAGKTHAVFSMLADKDMGQSVENIRSLIDSWYVAPLTTKRAASGQELAAVFQSLSMNAGGHFTTIEEAYAAARKNAQAGDRIVVFGSFHTVADVWRARKSLMT